MDEYDVYREAMKIIDGDLPGGKWCAACRIMTNHTTRQHDEAERHED